MGSMKKKLSDQQFYFVIHQFFDRLWQEVHEENGIRNYTPINPSEYNDEDVGYVKERISEILYDVAHKYEMLLLGDGNEE